MLSSAVGSVGTSLFVFGRSRVIVDVVEEEGKFCFVWMTEERVNGDHRLKTVDDVTRMVILANLLRVTFDDKFENLVGIALGV